MCVLESVNAIRHLWRLVIDNMFTFQNDRLFLDIRRQTGGDDKVWG